MHDLERFDTLFEDYLQRIVITQGQARQIDEALRHSVGYFMSAYDDIDIYAQGSYAMGVIVKPLTENQSPDNRAGDFDVDIVLERKGWGKARQSLDEIGELLAEEYSERVDPDKKNSCERVNFAPDSKTGVRFHVDYVPIKNLDGARYVAVRRLDDWTPSDSKRLTKWFLEYAKKEAAFPALIIILKRVRDVLGLSDVLSSTCIISLVSSRYCNTGTYAGDLLVATGLIANTFAGPRDKAEILVPETTENLAKRFSDEEWNEVGSKFKDTAELLGKQFSKGDKADLEAIRKVLGSDFPNQIEDYPDCLEPLRRRGFHLDLSGSLDYFELEARCGDGRNKRKKGPQSFFRGQEIKFTPKEYDYDGLSIRWQVLNSATSKERRGNLFEAKRKDGKTNSNKFENHETVVYDGVHWIRCILYNPRSKKVVAISKKFEVKLDDNSSFSQ